MADFYIGQLCKICLILESLPQDAISLSYWFVQNYQLTYQERLDILKCSDVLERLRREYRFLQTVSVSHLRGSAKIIYALLGSVTTITSGNTDLYNTTSQHLYKKILISG